MEYSNQKGSAVELAQANKVWFIPKQQEWAGECRHLKFDSIY